MGNAKNAQGQNGVRIWKYIPFFICVLSPLGMVVGRTKDQKGIAWPEVATGEAYSYKVLAQLPWVSGRVGPQLHHEIVEKTDFYEVPNPFCVFQNSLYFCQFASENTKATGQRELVQLSLDPKGAIRASPIRWSGNRLLPAKGNSLLLISDLAGELGTISKIDSAFHEELLKEIPANLRISGPVFQQPDFRKDFSLAIEYLYPGNAVEYWENHLSTRGDGLVLWKFLDLYPGNQIAKFHCVIRNPIDVYQLSLIHLVGVDGFGNSYFVYERSASQAADFSHNPWPNYRILKISPDCRILSTIPVLGNGMYFGPKRPQPFIFVDLDERVFQLYPTKESLDLYVWEKN